ncbi:M20 family metallopeptidase [Bosea vaviloviae]|uniref:Peptidase M20 dimerisation domain-containing protein n=1 Tax=Bosea vaviloviae TaxID=1526658 RepID=A0A1D7UC84_9HYPH|nr:M20 family metallopeptidase [Bosea vaviloviae]AOO84982.1 hypothetical protein BHK69_30145 [Bosea vaviloviae]
MPSFSLATADREQVVAAALRYVRDGSFFAEMKPRIAIASESPRLDSLEDNLRYLNGEIRPLLEAMGFRCEQLDNPAEARLPALFAERIEDPALPTILIYGHGDVLWGMSGDWKEGRDPWTLVEAEGRLYGRGIADNKGQHSINLAALRLVLERRGYLGFNVKVLIEMAEETGSLGLADIARTHRARLKADCLIASDGPRLGANSPTLFLGARGTVGFNLHCDLREGAYHSGNWGGLLANPGIRLTHALATLTDEKGRIALPEWRPERIPENVRAALKKLKFEKGADDPEIDDNWGEPGLVGPEQVYGWCNFEILALTSGRPEAPIGAVPPSARATCQLRFVVGVDPHNVVPALRAYLDARGFTDIRIEGLREDFYLATRTDLENPWAKFALGSMEQTIGRDVALQPNFGGSLPNDVFAEIIGMPTLWIPHSYPACSQHAPDEHMPVTIAEEGMQIMAGLFWDLGSPGSLNGIAKT